MGKLSQKKARSEIFDLQNKPRGKSEILVHSGELNITVEVDSSQITSELATGFLTQKLDILTLSIHFKQIGKGNKLKKWVPHESSEVNLQIRIECCITLLNRHIMTEF